MAMLTWIALILLTEMTYCHSTSKHKSHHHTNTKKSFLADAMKEMDNGENATATATEESVQNNTKAATPQDHNHHANKPKQKHEKKKVVNQYHFVARIFPSKIITEVSKKEQHKVDESKKHDDKTPKLGTVHSKLLSTGYETRKNKSSVKSDSTVLKDAESLVQNSSAPIIAPSSSLQHIIVSSTVTTSSITTSSNNSNPVSEKIDIAINHTGGKKKGHRKSIKDAIRLLQAFVEKLLKENETNKHSHSSKPKPTMKQPEKKDVLKEALPIHVHPDDGQSTVISGIKYNLAPVYRIKAKYSKDSLNASNGSSSTNSSLEQQQQQQQPQQQQQQPNQQSEQKQEQAQEQHKEQQEPQEKGKQQQQQQQQQQPQQQQEEQQKQKQRQQQQQQDNMQSKLQGNIEKLKQEEILLRQSLAEKELEIQKLRQQNPLSVNNASNQVAETTTRTPNITNESMKQDESPSSNDQKEMKFASLKGIPPELLMKLKTILEEKKKYNQNIVSKQEVHSRKAFETARKLVKAALAREQLFKAEQDFFEKVKEMMNKTSTTNLVKENTDAQKEATVNNDEGSTMKDYIQQIEDQRLLESKVRRTSPSPLQTNITSNTNTTQSLNDSISATTGHKGRNSSGAVPLDLQASTAKIMKQLNRTKGPEEKNVEAAAHLEEKVAEQQDEMYDKLIRQTLGKGMGGDDEDDEEDDEEEGVTRNINTENRPEGEMGRQENYGDFQDSDEDAQSRSDIGYVKNTNHNETLPAIDEDSLLSLRDKISRPTKEHDP